VGAKEGGREGGVACTGLSRLRALSPSFLHSLPWPIDVPARGSGTLCHPSPPVPLDWFYWVGHWIVLTRLIQSMIHS